MNEWIKDFLCKQTWHNKEYKTPWKNLQKNKQSTIKTQLDDRKLSENGFYNVKKI